MGALVKALVLRPIVREKTRTALTLLGIAVGVAVVVAIALSNQSALRAFRESVDAVAGRANWQIATDTDLDENVLLALQPLWARGVRFAPVMDIATAQTSFNMAGRLSRVDLIVPNDDEPTLSAIRRAVPPGARLERPSRRNERVEKMLRAFRVNLFALGGVALLVGMFLVYNTVLISILRRRKDVGVFKTLGASPRQIFAAFLGEGLVFGLLGSAIGIVLGDALAYGILRLIGRTINSLYISSTPQAIVLTPGIVAAGVFVGTALSLVSAIQPSIEAARVRPSLLIRPGLQQRIARSRRGALGVAAIICFALAV